MKTQDEVYEKWKVQFPLCFERTGCCMGFGLEYHAGWNPLIERLLTKIEIHLQQNPQLRDSETAFQIDQIKEKFGTLRFYVMGGDDEIFKWILEAESESEITCELCGKPGSLHCRKGAFWVQTICLECASTVRQGFVPYTEKENTP